MIKPRDDSIKPLQEMKQNLRRILVYPSDKGILFFVVENNRIVKFGTDEKGTMEVGDICLGRVSKIVKNINGTFVEIQDKNTCFLPESEIADPFIRNAQKSSSIKCGDEILIQIKKKAYKTKCAVATTKIKYESSQQEETVKEQATHCMLYKKLVSAESELEKYLRKNPFEKEDYIVTENRNAFEYLKEKNNLVINEHLKLYDDANISFQALYSVNKRIDEITNRKIWLKSGGTIFIDPTEAMTVIDVNTGKFEKNKSREETFLQINLEALGEICEQVKARNISGIIMIDFINMKDENNRNILIQNCKEYFRAKETGIQFVEYTKLGLVEATRVKKGNDIYEFLSKNNKTILR